MFNSEWGSLVVSRMPSPFTLTLENQHILYYDQGWSTQTFWASSCDAYGVPYDVYGQTPYSLRLA